MLYSKPGIYTLTPVSCCKFERDTYKYDTANPRLLDLQATHFLLNASVVTSKPTDNITINVVYVAARPFREMRCWFAHWILYSVDPSQKAGRKDGVNEEYHASMKSVEKQDNQHKYSFSIWVAPGEKLSLTPSAPAGSDLLFYPSTATFTL